MKAPNPRAGQSSYVTGLPTRTLVETGSPVMAGFWMTDHDYERLKKRVEEIEPQAVWPLTVGAGLAALIPAVGLQLIPWLSSFQTLSTQVQRQWGWVSGFMVASMVFSGLGILLCAFAWWRNRGRRTRDKESVLDDMRSVEAAARTRIEVSADSTKETGS